MGIRGTYYITEDYNELEEFLDIDKSWDAIHFTLCSEVEANNDNTLLSRVIFNRSQDEGEAVLSYWSVSEVKEIHFALQTISTDDFKARFDVPAMQKNEIYSVPKDEEADTFFSYCLEHFAAIKAFFKKACQNNKRLMLVIC